MAYQEIRSDLRGVAFTNPTPFNENKDNIQHDELSKNIQYILNSGGSLVIPCGNTGEYYSLTRDERVSVVETTADVVGEQGTVIGGVGGSTQSAIELANAYESAGADGIMIMQPSHTYQHQCGLLHYYQKIIESTNLGVVIYKRGSKISLNIIKQLAKYENVVGVKYAVNDINEFSKTVAATNEEIVWSNGIAERFAPSFIIEGAEGFTTGIGNFLPNETLRLMELLKQGEWDQAKQLRDLLRPFEDLRDETGDGNNLSAANNVPVVKYGMELAGLNGGPVREPLVQLNQKDKNLVEEHYNDIKGRSI